MPIPDPLTDGDAAFVGVNMNVEPSVIPQGFVALANNVRFHKGKIKTRPGTKCMDWSNIEGYENKTYAAGDKVFYSGKKATFPSDQTPSDTNMTLSNVANAITDGNFEAQTSLTNSSTPWFTENAPTNTSGGWSIDSTNNRAKVAAPSAALVNLNQNIGGTGNTPYGVELNIHSFNPILTVAGTTVDGVTSGYNMSLSVVKAGTSTIAGADAGDGGFSPSTTAQFKVEALTNEIPSGSVLVWFSGTTVTAKFTTTAVAGIGETELYGTLSEGTVNDNTKGYVEQTLTVNALHTTSGPSVNALVAHDTLYFDNRATFIITQNAVSGATTVKGTIHQNTLPVGAKGYGQLKVFIGNTNSKIIDITDGPFPRKFSTLVTSGTDDAQNIKLQADRNWLGEISDVSLSEPAAVVIQAKTGPASNEGIGPVFKRKSNANDEIHPPLTSGNLNTDYWEEVTGHTIFGLGTIYGVGTFNDPNGNETVLVATNTGLYGSATGSFFSIPMPNGESFAEPVEFVQAFHEVLVFRGFSKRPLILRNLVTGLESVEQRETDTDLEENENDGTEAIPNAKTGTFYQNRMFIPVLSGDEVIVSDFLNPTRYMSILSEFRINTGTSDSLVGLKVADETTGTLLAFKEHSVYRLSNVYGSLESVVLDTVTLDYGAINNKCITTIGKDVWFLSDKRGVSSLGLADNGKLTGSDVPVSEPVMAVIDSINWDAAKDVACAVYNNNHYYLAVPTDGATEVNKILVYSFINQSWCGYDTSTVITGMKGFVKLVHSGSREVFITDKNGFFHLYDDYRYGSDIDDVPNSTSGAVTKTAISTEVLSRGYVAGDISFKKWRTARMQSKTQNPTLTVDAEFEGVNESVNLVTNKTYDRTKFDRPYDATDYVVTSASNFFGAYRQDYTVQANDFATAFTDAPASDKIFDPDIMADHENRYALRGEGRYMQLRIKNTTGRQEITAMSVGAIPSETLLYKKQ